MILLSNIWLAMKQKTEKTISLWTFWIMFSRVHWNLLSALNILLYFTYYTKFPFPYCSKVTRESQQKTPIKFKVNECHFVLNCQSTNVFFFRTFFFFFTCHLLSLKPSLSTSAFTCSEIKGNLINMSFLNFILFSQNVHLLFTFPRHRGRNGCPITQSFPM